MLKLSNCIYFILPIFNLLQKSQNLDAIFILEYDNYLSLQSAFCHTLRGLKKLSEEMILFEKISFLYVKKIEGEYIF